MVAFTCGIDFGHYMTRAVYRLDKGEYTDLSFPGRPDAALESVVYILKVTDDDDVSSYILSVDAAHADDSTAIPFRHAKTYVGKTSIVNVGACYS